MYRFWDLVTEPILDAMKPSSIVEVGSDNGLHTRLLLEYCRQRGGVVHSVDLLPKYDVSAWRKEYGKTFVFHRSLSLDALPDIEDPDLVLIDGDHNWYTVFNELKLLEETARNKGDFPLVLLHDVGWPYGRRDLYYDPESIPPEYRHPYEREGVEREKPELSVKSGLNGHLCNAVHEGGQRNGVLTAVEDFVRGSDVSLELLVLPVVYGLAMLVPASLSERNEAVEAVIRPFRELSHKTVRDDLLALVENERINDEIRLTTELRACSEDFERRIRREELQTQRLLLWMLQLNALFSKLLTSRQWKAGQALKGAYDRVSRRPAGPSAAQNMTEVFREFADWCVRNEVKRKPDLAYDGTHNEKVQNRR